MIFAQALGLAHTKITRAFEAMGVRDTTGDF